MGMNLSFVPAAPGKPLTAYRAIGLMFWTPPLPDFTHPMMSAQNYRANYRMGDLERTRRVVDRLKPIGFTGGGRQTQACVDKVRNAGGTAHAWAAGRAGEHEPLYGLTMHANQWIGAVFDVPALLDVYRVGLRESPEMYAQVERLLLPLRDAWFADYLDFCRVDAPDRSGAYLARTGLLLGYPVATTIAMLRQNLGLSGGVTTAARQAPS